MFDTYQIISDDIRVQPSYIKDNTGMSQAGKNALFISYGVYCYTLFQRGRSCQHVMLSALLCKVHWVVENATLGYYRLLHDSYRAAGGMLRNSQFVACKQYETV